MAQLKDTVISGSLRVTDTTYTTTVDLYALRVPTSSGSTAHGVGTAGQILHSNGTASYWGAMTSGELPSHTHPYLPTSGGTMTGVLTVKADQYTDSYSGALNMNNSDIYNLNSIYTKDASDTANEGIHFYRDASHVDTLWMSGGDLLFVPNRLLSSGSSSTATKAESEKVARLPKTITTGQLVMTDTTGGLLKTISTGTFASSSHTHSYLPATGADRGLDITSNKIGHTKSLTASANISGTANVSGWGQTATVVVPSIDAYGHSTAYKTKTITMPSSTGLATTAYVNERVANAVHFKGGFNANNADALKTPLKEVGDMYLVSTAGTFYGLALEVGDSIIFQSTVAAGTNPTSADFIGVEKTVSVENKGPTLSWGNTSTVGVVEGVNFTVKMPANPNTDTKVTAVGNHYTPSSSGTFTPAAGGTTTNISSTVVNYIAGLQKDAAGHVTDIVSGSIKADANTDTKVTAVGNHYTPTSSGTFTPAAGGTTTDISTTTLNIITGLQKDAAGHITGVVSGSIKSTNTDTKNTAGSTNSDSKLFLIGATSQAANPQTYSDSEVYTTNGTLTTKITQATQTVNVNTANSSTTGGVSLYGTDPTQYGVAMRGTGNGGKHGGVQGDWAIYTYMAGATNRGFVWKNSSTAVASLDCAGNEVLNGSLTVGGSSANDTGVQLSFNKNTSSLDFIFV